MKTGGERDLEELVTGALATVTDPELDRSLVELGFARAAVDDAGRATVEIRLPTYWCASNFAFLMASDARAAVAAVPGVRSVAVRLLDHFAGDEVSGAVNEGRSLDDAFGEETDGSGLEGLRRLFLVKAFTARQEQLIRRLLGDGLSPSRICSMRLGELDQHAPDCRAYLEKRCQLGLPADGGAALAVRPNGEPLGAADLDRYLSRARLTRIGMEANTSLCRGLHSTRYSMPQEMMI